jgi:hypothetical protein
VGLEQALLKDLIAYQVSRQHGGLGTGYGEQEWPFNVAIPHGGLGTLSHSDYVNFKNTSLSPSHTVGLELTDTRNLR